MRKTLNILSEAWKYVIPIAGFAGMIWGGFEIYESITDTQEMVIDVWEQHLILEQGMEEGFQEINDTLERVEGKIDNNARGIYTNRRMFQYELEHRNEFTPEQMREILEEIKKNTTVLDGSSSEITIDNENTTLYLSQ